ncbi:MAG: succinate dehydrogenase, partial [Deltaproteobacteria bacterium]
GMLTLVFLIVHLKNFRFAKSTLPVADQVRQLLHQPVFALFYMFALVGVGFHICHGLWSLLQSLGVNHPKYNLLLEKGAVTAGTIIAALFFMIPLLALLVNGFLK